jgi:phospholipase C
MLTVSGSTFSKVLALAAIVGLASCSPTGGASRALIPAAAQAPNAPTPIGTYIKHVVIVVQENRTFDNIFAGYPGADTVMVGKCKPIASQHVCPKGSVPLKAIPYAGEHDMSHNYTPAWIAADCSGKPPRCKMDKFDLNGSYSGVGSVGTYPYAYLERNEVAPYWTMAKDYALLDHMFPTELGPSFTSHLNLIAGTDELVPNTVAEANYPTGFPWGCDAGAATSFTVGTNRVVKANGPPPCFTQFRTIADVLDAKHVSWRYYAPPLFGSSSSGGGGGQLWTAFDAISKVRYGPDWKNIVSPQTTVLKDAAAGRLPAVSYVIPDWVDSDWPTGSDTGPSWVASIVNAVGKGPDWSSTAIVVLWDDWGGWYDNAAPPVKDFRGLGIRVPCLIVSPYVKPGTVSHTVYEFGSILRFVEQAFNLSPIGPTSEGYTDQRATSLANSFDFTQKPRRFTPIPQKYPESYFLNKPPSGHWVDDQ